MHCLSSKDGGFSRVKLVKITVVTRANHWGPACKRYGDYADLNMLKKMKH